MKARDKIKASNQHTRPLFIMSKHSFHIICLEKSFTTHRKNSFKLICGIIHSVLMTIIWTILPHEIFPPTYSNIYLLVGWYFTQNYHSSCCWTCHIFFWVSLFVQHSAIISSQPLTWVANQTIDETWSLHRLILIRGFESPFLCTATTNDLF